MFSVVQTAGSDFYIRAAKQDDLFYFLTLTKEFHKESNYGVWDKGKVTETFNSYVDNPNAAIFFGVYKDEPVSFIFGIIGESWSSRSRVAIELGWYTSKEYRGRTKSLNLMKEFERWARACGATNCSFSSLSVLKSLSSVYSRAGYKESEITYTRSLQ